jgi:hypothetical protein
MSTRIDPDLLANAILDADDADEWTLDELERSADLDSARSAWNNSYDPNE